MNLVLAVARPAIYFRAKPKHQTVVSFSDNPIGRFAGVNLTDEEVTEFKHLYERVTGQSIDFATARAKATKLMTFVHVLLRHYNVDTHDEPAD
jgi:hypothetical protein